MDSTSLVSKSSFVSWAFLSLASSLLSAQILNAQIDPPGIEWQQTFGGSENDSGLSVEQTSDGGYVLCGSTASFGAGGLDVYLVKLRGDGPPSGRFLRGDCNDDGAINISDGVFTLGSLFLGDGDPGCDDACDSNDDGTINISDAIATLGVLFLGNGIIALPGMNECGIDPTEDEIGCTTFGQCP